MSTDGTIVSSGVMTADELRDVYADMASEPVHCPECGGATRVAYPDRIGWRDCPLCEGTGIVTGADVAEWVEDLRR